jgi:hypothetical protein
MELWQIIGLAVIGVVWFIAMLFVAWLTAKPVKVLPFRRKRKSS